MNCKVILDLPNGELYSIISNLRSEAIQLKKSETDEEILEDLDCRIAGLDQMAYELSVTDDIPGEDRAWLLSLLNSSPSIQPWLVKIRSLEEQAFNKVTAMPLFKNICTIIDWVELGAITGSVTPAMEERLANVENLLGKMVI